MKYRIVFNHHGEAVQREPEIREAASAAEALAMCDLSDRRHGDAIFVQAMQLVARKFIHEGYAIKAEPTEILIDAIPRHSSDSTNRIDNG